MNTMTLKSIIEMINRNDEFLEKNHDEIIRITGKVLKLLLQLDLEEKLAEETKIFINCRKSSKHIYNILFNYSNRSGESHETLDYFIDLELEKILEDDYLLHQEERLKSEILSRTKDLHSHLKHVEQMLIDYNTGEYNSDGIRGSDLSSIFNSRLNEMENKMEEILSLKLNKQIIESEKRMVKFFLNITERQRETSEEQINKLIKLATSKKSSK